MKKIISISLIITIIGLITIPLITNAKTSDKEKEQFANVVLFAYFKGDTEGRDYLINETQNMLKMYNGTGELSVKGYLNKISYGKFELKNIFPQYDGNKIIPYELPCSIDGLDKNNLDYTIIHSLITSIPDIKDKLDYNNDGFIDNFSIVLKGGSESVESNSTLVSHKSDYGSDESWSGKRIGTYNMLNTYSIKNSGAGVIAHEFMHSLGYPDLYTSEAGSYPVYSWDIMGQVSKYMSYPLAYLRMKYTNWINIDTITKSQTLKLDTQDNPNGNQAYILKSPFNEYELFVVEFRKKSADMEHLDRSIGHSGIIVYRVNTTVTGLSNNRGQTGVYVFREESGKKDDSTLRGEIYNASYSKETGKTTIGSSDLNVTKGTLTFSDGTNSGIVISNISNSDGNNMTFDVTIPDAKDYDTWKNTNYKDETGVDEYTPKNADIISYKNKIYTVSTGNNKIYTSTYEGSEWKNINTANMENTNYITGVSLLNFNEELYLITSSWPNINLYKYNNGWTKVTSLSDTNGSYSYKVYNEKLYITKVDGSSHKASLYEFKNNTLSEIGTYYEGNTNEFVGIPKIEVINNNIYAICRNSYGNIKIYQLENNKFKEITSNLNSNQFDVVSLNNKIYFALGSDTNNKTMKMVVYDGNNFETINTDITFGEPKITVSQGNLYVLVTDITGTEKAKVYAYNQNNKKFEQEGIDVDNAVASGSLNLASIDNKIYVQLKRLTDGIIVVKEKETVNSLLCKHLNKTTIPVKAATCTENGNNKYKICDDCGKVFKADGVTETTVEAEKTKALGHDFSIPRANETQHWNECSRCGIADTKINHVGEGDYGKDSTKHWKVCGCGTKVDEEEHKASAPVKENEKPATCTTDGSHDEVIYCSVCGYKMSITNKVDKATGHTAGEAVKENEKPATCTTEGTYNEVKYCKVCNTKISSTPKTIPAKGHTPGEPVKENIVPATHTTKGSYNEVIYCKVCNTKISTTTKETPIIPHDVTDAAWSSDETNHWKECGCGTKVEISAHVAGDAVKENVVPATCTKDGSHDEVVYCSVCGREISRTSKVDKAIGHTEGETVKENIVPATCTKDGSHDEVVKCKTCSAEISRTKKTDKAKGHTPGEAVKEDEVPATCTAEGKYNEVVYCKTCNAKISSTPKTIPAKGHTEGAITIENEIEATVNKEGSYEEVIYCSECNKELSRTKKTTPKFVYAIIEGAGSTHQNKDSNEITIKSNGKFNKFQGIKVDEKLVDKSNYTAKSGSTIVTLKADYLNTLSIGEHKIAFVYDDGEVETEFVIAESKKTEDNKNVEQAEQEEKNTSKEETSNQQNTKDDNKQATTPKTDDLSNIVLWRVGLAVSGILFVIVLGCKIKGSRKKARH